MGTTNVLFVFSAPATQCKTLTGSTATTGICTPDIALIDDGGGAVVLSGIANASPFTYRASPARPTRRPAPSCRSPRTRSPGSLSWLPTPTPMPTPTPPPTASVAWR